MGRRRDRENLSDDALYKEFAEMESMRVKKLTGGGFKDFKIQEIQPLTDAQKDVFDYYEQGYNLVLHGSAGTGKTFLVLYLALCEVFAKKYKNIVIVRSAVPSRDIGFLPGTLEEKIDVYKLPYAHICTKLFGTEDAFDRLESRGVIVFTTTSFLRGMTFDDCIVVVDEYENYAGSECHTIMTRLGQNCKIMFCGDFEQSDFQKDKEKTESKTFIGILSQMNEIKMVRFDIEDVVRSGLIKSYLIARQKYLSK